MWDTLGMDLDALLNRSEIASACETHGVSRLQIFGSSVTSLFDPALSDVDFLVEFKPEVGNLFRAYFGLRDDLVRIVGREVDLVMANAVENPFFAASAFENAQELYAA